MAEVYDSRADMLEMPTEYKELSEEEKEYDGGFWNPISAVLTVASIGLTIAGAYTGNKTIKTAAAVVSVASAITSFGASTAALATLGTNISKKAAAKTVATYVGDRVNIAYTAYDVGKSIKG